MRKTKKKSVLLLTVMLISLLAGSVNVFAAEEDVVEVTQKDTAENVIMAEVSPADKSYERDVYWFGNEVNMYDTEIKGDLIAAGYNLFVETAEVGGSIRSASYGLKLNDVSVENNITAMGNSLSFNENTTAKGIYVCGNDISYSGECDALYAAGNIVIFNGVVNGDAVIEGNRVTIGSDAVVTGKLTVNATDMPQIPDAAAIEEFEYIETPEIDPATAEVISPITQFIDKIINRAYWIPAMIMVAMFFCLVMPGAIDGSGKMLLKKPVAMPVTGLVSILALPFALILLCITWIGLPSAGLVTLLALPMFIFAVPFVGASAGRIVLPKMNVWLSSIIGTAVLTIVIIIPVLGGWIKFLCMVYVFGYFIQKCYEQIKMLGKKPAVENPQSISAENVSSSEK